MKLYQREHVYTHNISPIKHDITAWKWICTSMWYVFSFPACLSFSFYTYHHHAYCSHWGGGVHPFYISQSPLKSVLPIQAAVCAPPNTSESSLFAAAFPFRWQCVYSYFHPSPLFVAALPIQVAVCIPLLIPHLTITTI